MTVYVDEYLGLMVPAKWRGGGHMLTTDIEELHILARRIGLKREWFQDKTWPHYDLTANKRRLAIQAGAVPVEAGEFPDTVLMRCSDGTYETEKDRMNRRSSS